MNDVLVAELEGAGNTLLLSLEDDHYSMIEIKKYQQCTECGRKYISKHTFNTNMKVFKMITEGRNRYFINPFKSDKFNFDVPNDSIVIVHYDIVRIRNKYLLESSSWQVDNLKENKLKQQPNKTKVQ